MSTSLFVGILFAVVVFWAVGAYNRLMRLRARCTEAFTTLGQHLLDYSRIAKEHWTYVEKLERQIPSQESDSVYMLLRNLQEELGTIELLINDPKAGWWEDLHFKAIGVAGNAIACTWGRLRSIPSDLAGQAIPDALVREWDANSMGLKINMDRFNGLVAEYNEAVTQFPAVLIGRFFQLKPFTPFSIFNEA